MHPSRPTSFLATALLAALAVAACSRDEAPATTADDATPAADTTVPPAASEAPPATTPVPAPADATARIAGAGGNAATGELAFHLLPAGGVHVTGSLAGLAPDTQHGFHVHEKGDCSDPAGGSAGTHFNPTAQPHGGPDAAARHAGDMPNLRADANGTASVDITLAEVGLGTGDDRDLAGRAIVVHEKADDYATQPSGASGTPIACGVIAAGAPPPA